MDQKFLKPFNPQETEPRIYAIWEKSGYFNPDNLPGDRKAPFTIMMPPPNVTGVLHMGHALMITIEDIMVRFERMRGKKTLWLPGTDHAAIATQSKVEKEIQKKEDKSRHDLGREEFLRRVEVFAKESHDTIVSQIKAVGASCDWSREAFTLDEKRTRAVRTVFKSMYDAGLIYRGLRVINWDPKGQTTISDDEIVYEERSSTLYTFTYDKDFPIAISTTRPETKVGDTAVAVHPEDIRYKKYIGKTFTPTFVGVPLTIKIVADTNVDMNFGTGALGVTPAHSMIDAEIANRHNLPLKQVIDERARMMNAGETLTGKKITEAREIIIGALREQNILQKEEIITQNIATAERTGGIIEPLPKLQWFINVNKEIPGRNKTLKQLTKEPFETGAIKITPDYFSKTYFNWIDNLRDWCISRQIWYGHRIPVWYKNDEMYVGIEAPTESGWTQDADTLDTWFSSGLWTFSTLGWPEKTLDLKTFHPTDVLETGYEILFFWVARMVLMTGFVLGTIPFKNVYLHGTVRDAKGRKMSKSLGNGIDPLDVTAKFGADAGRMALVVGTAPGTDSKISEDKIRGYKHFANKLWNISRFVFENTADTKRTITFKEFSETDKAHLLTLDTLLKEITKEMEGFKFYLSAEKLYHYTWHSFADLILEESKKIFSGTDNAAIVSRKHMLLQILRTILITLHPFTPFVTEEIWSSFPGTTNVLMIEPWPLIE